MKLALALGLATGVAGVAVAGCGSSPGTATPAQLQDWCEQGMKAYCERYKVCYPSTAGLLGMDDCAAFAASQCADDGTGDGCVPPSTPTQSEVDSCTAQIDGATCEQIVDEAYLTTQGACGAMYNNPNYQCPEDGPESPGDNSSAPDGHSVPDGSVAKPDGAGKDGTTSKETATPPDGTTAEAGPNCDDIQVQTEGCMAALYASCKVLLKCNWPPAVKKLIEECDDKITENKAELETACAEYLESTLCANPNDPMAVYLNTSSAATVDQCVSQAQCTSDSAQAWWDAFNKYLETGNPAELLKLLEQYLAGCY